MKIFLTTLLVLILCTSCTENFTHIHVDPYMDNAVPKIPLEDRGWTKHKREFFVKTEYGKKLSQWEQNALINKIVTMGLNKNLLQYMYGYPNRNINDTMWVYLGENERVLLEVKLNHLGQVYDYFIK